MSGRTTEGPIEPEVLPPEQPEHTNQHNNKKRAERAFGPVIAGLILDLADFTTLGPLGFLLGAGIGWWLGSIFDLPKRYRLTVALFAGLYCMMPLTRFIPAATLIGAGIRFFND